MNHFVLRGGVSGIFFFFAESRTHIKLFIVYEFVAANGLGPDASLFSRLSMS